jgi:hypothetical protein
MPCCNLKLVEARDPGGAAQKTCHGSAPALIEATVRLEWLTDAFPLHLKGNFLPSHRPDLALLAAPAS